MTVALVPTIVFAALADRFFTLVSPVQPIGVRQPIPLPFAKGAVFKSVPGVTPNQKKCLDESDPSGLYLASQVDAFAPLTLMAHPAECQDVSYFGGAATPTFAQLSYNTSVKPIASELAFTPTQYTMGSLQVNKASWLFYGCPALTGCTNGSPEAHSFTVTVNTNKKTKTSVELDKIDLTPVFANGTALTLAADTLRPGYIYGVTASLAATTVSNVQGFNDATVNIRAGRTTWLFTHGPPVGGSVSVSPSSGKAVVDYFDVATRGWKALVDVMAGRVSSEPSREALLVHYEATFPLPSAVHKVLSDPSLASIVLPPETYASVMSACEPFTASYNETVVQPYVASLLIQASVTGVNASAFCADIIVISKALMSSTIFNSTSNDLKLEPKKLYPLKPLTLQYAFRVDDHALSPPLPVASPSGALDTAVLSTDHAADLLAHLRSQEMWPGSPLTSLTTATSAYLPFPLPGTTSGSINMTAGIATVYAMAVDSEANVGYAVFNVSLAPPLSPASATNTSSVSTFITEARDKLYNDFVLNNASKPLPPLSVLTMCQTLGNILQSASSAKALQSGEGIDAHVAEANALSRHHLALFVKTAMESLAAEAGAPTPTSNVTGWRANLGVSKPDANAMVAAAALDAGSLQAAAGSLSSFVNDPFELAKNAVYHNDMEKWSTDALKHMMALSLPRQSNATTAAAVAGAQTLEPIDDANLALTMSVITGLAIGRTMPAPTVGPDGKVTLTVGMTPMEDSGSGSGGGHSQHGLRRRLQAAASRTRTPTRSPSASVSATPSTSATPRRSMSPLPLVPPVAQPMPPASAQMMAANLAAVGSAAMRAAMPGDPPVSLTGGMPPAVVSAINTAASSAFNAAVAAAGGLPPGATMPPGLGGMLAMPSMPSLVGASAPPMGGQSAPPFVGVSPGAVGPSALGTASRVPPAGIGGPSNAAAPPSLGPFASIPMNKPTIPPLATIDPACMPPDALAMVNLQAQRMAVPVPAGMTAPRRLAGTHPESPLAAWAEDLSALAESARLHPRRVGRRHAVLSSYRAPARRLQAAPPPAGCPVAASVPAGAGAGLPSMFTPLLAPAASVSVPPAVLQGLAAAGLAPPGGALDIQTTTFVVPPHNMTADWQGLLPPELSGLNISQALSAVGPPGTMLTAAQALAAVAAMPPLQNVIPLPAPMASGTTSINMMTPRGQEVPVNNTQGGGIIFTIPLASGFPMSDGLPPPVMGPDTIMVQCPTQAQVNSKTVVVGSTIGVAKVLSITNVKVNQTVNAVVPPTAAKLPLQAFAPGNAPIPPPTPMPGQAPTTVTEVVSSIVELTVSCGDRGSARAVCGQGLLGTSVPVACPVPKAAPLPTCGYWDTETNNWDTDGCTMISFDAVSVTCNCTHLTDFVARFDALAESQVQVFSSALELDDAAAYERAFYVFITIAVVGAVWLVSVFAGCRLDRTGKLRFYRFLRSDKEIQSLVALEAARGGHFLVDREFDSDMAVQADLVIAEEKEKAAAAAAAGAAGGAAKKQKKTMLESMYERSRAFAASRVVVVDENTAAAEVEGAAAPAPAAAVPSAIPEGNEHDDNPASPLPGAATPSSASKEGAAAHARPSLDLEAAGASGAAPLSSPGTPASPRRRRCDTLLSSIPVFTHMWYMRVVYSHSFIGILTRYDPQNLRWARFSLFFTMLVTNLFFTAFFYGYTYGTPTSSLPGQLSYAEALVLSLISSAIAFPIELVLNWAYARAAEMSFKYRHLGIFSELYRRKVVGKKLAKLTNEELRRIGNPELAAASPYGGATSSASNGSMRGGSMRGGSLRFFRSSKVLPGVSASSAAQITEGSEEAGEAAGAQPAKAIAPARKAVSGFSLKDFEKKKTYHLTRAQVVSSLAVGLGITAAWCAFCLFYVILFGVWQPMDVTTAFLASWVQAIAIGALVMEPLMMGLTSAWLVFIQPRLVPCLARAPLIRKLPAFADETTSTPSLRSVLTSRLENVTLVSAAGFASQLQADQAVFVFGATSVVSALLRGVVSGVASAFRARANSTGMDAAAQHRAALLQRAYVRLRMDAAISGPGPASSQATIVAPPQ